MGMNKIEESKGRVDGSIGESDSRSVKSLQHD